MMKIREIITKLQQYNQELDVTFYDGDSDAYHSITDVRIDLPAIRGIEGWYVPFDAHQDDPQGSVCIVVFQ